MEEQLIIEIWDTFKDYITEKNRDTAANHFVDFLLGRDIEPSKLEGILGYDPHLDSAIELVLENENYEDEEEQDDSWDYDEEEE